MRQMSGGHALKIRLTASMKKDGGNFEKANMTYVQILALAGPLLVHAVPEAFIVSGQVLGPLFGEGCEMRVPYKGWAVNG